MSKTNFTKVEIALAEGMQKLKRQKLLQQTNNPNQAKAKEETEYFNSEKIATQLAHDLNALYKKDKLLYQKLGFNKEEVKKLLYSPTTLSAEDWKTVLSLKEKMDLYKEEFKKEQAHIPNEKIVEKERHRHLNKRFNINEKWLPLK